MKKIKQKHLFGTILNFEHMPYYELGAYANGTHAYIKWLTNKGDDYCGKGHACHINATCLNLNTKYSCTCRLGFQGNGFDCTGLFSHFPA